MSNSHASLPSLYNVLPGLLFAWVLGTHAAWLVGGIGFETAVMNIIAPTAAWIAGRQS